MKLTLDVSKVMVVEGRSGPDKVIMFLNGYPEACFPYKPNSLALDFDAASGQGVGFVKKHFGLEPEVIKLPDTRIPFSNGDSDGQDIQTRQGTVHKGIGKGPRGKGALRASVDSKALTEEEKA